jgi:hypothetical protein
VLGAELPVLEHQGLEPRAVLPHELEGLVHFGRNFE